MKTKTAPILSPSFAWIKSTDHLTPEGMNAFAERQRARIAAAQKPPSNVKPIGRKVKA